MNEDNYDLPRWQTHPQPPLDSLPSPAQANPPPQYMYTGGPPPSLTAGGRLPSLQSSPAQSRQPRMPHILDHDQSPSGKSSQYNPGAQGQLSRSSSLGAHSALSSSRGRRHHQPEDLEGNLSPERSPYSSSRQQLQGGNSFYAPGVGGYQSQSMTSNPTPNLLHAASTPAGDGYSEAYYSPGSGAPKRSNTVHESKPPLSHNQSRYSPTPNAYSYGSSTEQKPQSSYSHSRSHSQVKMETASPGMSSPYSPQGPIHNSSGYSSPYGMDSTSPHLPQNNLNVHLSPRHQQTSLSNPSSPLYMHPSQSHSGQYLPHDHSMMVDPPPQKRRVAGFRRVRDNRDLQPRLDAQPTNRRMDQNGDYLSPLRQLTTNILETYHICNPQFRYESTHNPRRVLTKPSKPAHNEGYDNDDYDYILYVNDWLGTEDGHKYLILDILGQGTFGQVVKCQNMKTHDIVAVKVVKNKPAYFNQSMMEVTILELLNKQFDPNDEHHILRMRDSFIHRSHLCLVFELLSSNLYELIKQNQFQGLSTQLVKVFMAQLLDSMTILKEARLIHCDLKPENILLKSLQSPQIKIIDFGSACHERQTVYTYIQSRFYRSPEVLLGLSYTAAIDMWSLGCIAVELFLGLPLFPGTSEYNQLTRIVEMLGMPPQSMLNVGKQTSQFFDSFEVWNAHAQQNEKKYRLKSIEQYSREHNTNEQPGKQYFKATSLPEIINTAPMPTFKSSRHGAELEKELNNRASFIDFCQGLLNMNPVTRWTPQQARLHPFITGEKFVKPFVPDGITQQHSGQSVSSPDSKRPYGGLVPSQPKGSRAYQDAATYNQHLAQHQVYTAQAASQANNTFRNPYMSSQTQQQAQQSPPQPQQPPQQSPSYAMPQEPSYSQQQQPQYSVPQSTGNHRPLIHQNSAGQLNQGGYIHQYPSAGMNTGLSSNAHLSPNVPSNTYYPNTRNRANTINQVDSGVPPALARLQHMNQDVIAGRNALTPVLNRDDAMREWERRQSGKPSAAQPYPQLEFLQQQAEMAAASGLPSWSTTGTSNRYPPPSKLSHSYQPSQPTIVVDDDRRDAVMSNVRSAARGEGANALYGSSSATIAAPAQAYSSNSTTAGNRYPASYSQQQQQTGSVSPFDERRQDLGSVYIPMQPEQYQAYSASSSNAASRHAPPSNAAPSFYGAHVVPDGQQTHGQRNPFSATEPPPTNLKEGRRNSGMDVWQR